MRVRGVVSRASWRRFGSCFEGNAVDGLAVNPRLVPPANLDLRRWVGVGWGGWVVFRLGHHERKWLLYRRFNSVWRLAVRSRLRFLGFNLETYVVGRVDEVVSWFVGHHERSGSCSKVNTVERLRRQNHASFLGLIWPTRWVGVVLERGWVVL